MNNFPQPRVILCVQNPPSPRGPVEAQSPTGLETRRGSETQGSLSQPDLAVL